MKYSFFTSIITRIIVLVLIAILPALGVIIYSGLELRKNAIDDAQMPKIKLS